ncbi:MAG: PilZ domain-containing protein [Desulfovibrionaceae bacterium]
MAAHHHTADHLLEAAIAQRSRCFLSLPTPVMPCREIVCAILEYSSRGLILESLEQVAAGPHWLGQPVRGYFCIAQSRQVADATFYTFDSRIRATKTSPRGLARLGLAQPGSVVFGQRRKSLRVEPDPARIRELLVWRYDRKDGFRFDAPLLKLEDFRSGAARVLNLSAGGLGLGVSHALAGSSGLDMQITERCIIHCCLDEPRVAGTHAFWLVARLRHVDRDRLGQHLTAGLEFLATGNLDAAAGKIRWLPVDDHGVAALAEICYLWHLDRHRERQS